MHTLPRLGAAALVAVIVGTGFCGPVHGAAGFGDVDDDRWYSEPIAWLVDEHITTGTEPGCFSPAEAITRGQAVTFLHRLDHARGEAPVESAHPFTDVIAAYQQTPVGWAFAHRITVGTSASTFAPDTAVSRGDFAVLLWRYAGTPAPTSDHRFVDVTRAYQHDAIAWMAGHGITTGTTVTTFSPDSVLTRAEAATFLHRFMGRPTATGQTASAPCSAPLRALLEDRDMTPDEAACAAPHLEAHDLDHLAAVLAGTALISAPLIETIAAIAADGCISPARHAIVIALFV